MKIKKVDKEKIGRLEIYNDPNFSEVEAWLCDEGILLKSVDVVSGIGRVLHVSTFNLSTVDAVTFLLDRYPGRQFVVCQDGDFEHFISKELNNVFHVADESNDNPGEPS